MKQGRHVQKSRMMKQIGRRMMVLLMGSMLGIGGCHWFENDRQDSPTTPVGHAFELGNYMQQTGQSRVVAVNGEQHQINGVVSGNVVAGGLYIEINEQSSAGQPAGTFQIAVSLQDVKITLTGLPPGVSAIRVSSKGTEIGQYAVSDGSVEITLSWAQWTQWFGPTHYAVVCEAMGGGALHEMMAAVSGRLASGEVVTFGKGFGSVTTGGGCSPCPECPPPPTTGGSCSACPECPPPPTTCGLNDPPQLTDNGNGTVTDACTGLIWLKNANCNSSSMLNHAAATTWAAGLASGSCGLSDGSTTGQWRLPTKKELQSILDESHYSPALPTGHPFTNVQNYYWTSTNTASLSTSAWVISLGTDGGRVVGARKTDLTNYAWAVR